MQAWILDESPGSYRRRAATFGFAPPAAPGTSAPPTRLPTSPRTECCAAFDSAELRWPVEADVVIESVGPATWEQSMRSLKPGGRLEEYVDALARLEQGEQLGKIVLDHGE
jgi:hypothetical protein